MRRPAGLTAALTVGLTVACSTAAADGSNSPSTPDSTKVIVPPDSTTTPQRVQSSEEAATEADLAAMRRRCEDGDAEACVDLAGVHQRRDERELMKTYEKRGCELGSGRGCVFYANNFSAQSDDELPTLLEYADRGCALRWADGCTWLGRMHLIGIGVAADEAAARRYKAAACDAGEPTACVSFDEWSTAQRAKWARMSNRKPPVLGSLPKDIIRTVVRAHIDEVTECYNRGLAIDAQIAGRVAIQFVISRDGTISEATVVENDLETRVGEQIAQCIAGAISTWTFPRPKGGGNVVVTYPFNLST